jgi:hypothetical protein
MASNYKRRFDGSIQTPDVNINNIINNQGASVFNETDDKLTFNTSTIDFNNKTIENLIVENLNTGNIASNNLGHTTLDSELDNHQSQITSINNKTTGLTGNRVMVSSVGGNLAVGTITPDDIFLKSSSSDTFISSSLVLPNGKNIKVIDNSGTASNYTAANLEGWTVVENAIDGNTNRTTGLTIDKVMVSDVNGNLVVGTYNEDDFLNNKLLTDQMIKSNLHFTYGKGIIYDGVDLSHRNLSGWDSTQDEIDLNTGKQGITNQQTIDILLNNNKVGVTSQNLSDISTNNNKLGVTSQNLSDITANNNKVGVTSQNLSDITANNNKLGVTSQNLTDIGNNNNKTGITTQQIADINSSTSNIINLINNKANKSTPTFTGLTDGLCRIDSNVMSSGYSLVSGDIPDIPSTKINTTLSESQIPNLQGSKIVSLLDSSIIPNLSTDKITSGLLPLTRLVNTVVNTDSAQTLSGLKSCSNGIVSGSFSGTQYAYLGEAGAIALKNTAQETGIYFNYESSGMAIHNNASSGLTLEGGDLDIETGGLLIGGSALSSTNLADSSNLIRNNVSGQNITESIIISGGSNLTIVNGTHEARFGVDPNAGHLTITNSINLSGGEIYKIGNSQISSSDLSNDSSLLKSGVQQGSINCNGDFFLRDDTTDVAIISYQQSNNNTFFQGSNIYYLDGDGNTTLNINLSNTNPNIVVNASSDISRGSTAVFSSITSINTDITALEALSSTYVNKSSAQTIGGQKQFSNQINVVDAGNNSNLSILHNDGRLYMRNTDNGSSFVQMISNNFSSKLSSDESTSTLICDKDFNLESGRQYKINNVALSSGNLSNDSNIAKLDSISSTNLTDSSNIAKLDSISSTNLADSSNLIKKNVTGQIITETLQLTKSLGCVTDAFNNTVLSNNGRIDCDNNDGAGANIRLTTNAHVVNISSDSSNQTLYIDQDVNLNTGKKYKINNTQISSSDLLDVSNLMLKPTIWTKTGAQSIKIQSTRDADSLLFERADTWFNTTTNTYEEIPDFEGDYSIYIEGETVSSQFGLYFFSGSFSFIIRATTNDGDASPQIVLPVSCFHHASTHGNAIVTLQPIASNNWKVYLTWDAVGVNDTNDILEYTMKLRKNYWG